MSDDYRQGYDRGRDGADSAAGWFNSDSEAQTRGFQDGQRDRARTHYDSRSDDYGSSSDPLWLGILFFCVPATLYIGGFVWWLLWYLANPTDEMTGTELLLGLAGFIVFLPLLIVYLALVQIFGLPWPH